MLLRMSLPRLAVYVAFAGILSSCGGGDADTAAADAGMDPAAEVEVDPGPRPGAMMVDMGDFPIPAAPGAQEIMGGAPTFLLAYPNEDFGRVLNFYEDWVADQEGEYTRVDASETLGDEIKGIGWMLADGSRMIMVAEEDFDERRTVVNLTAHGDR